MLVEVDPDDLMMEVTHLRRGWKRGSAKWQKNAKDLLRRAYILGFLDVRTIEGIAVSDSQNVYQITVADGVEAKNKIFEQMAVEEMCAVIARMLRDDMYI